MPVDPTVMCAFDALVPLNELKPNPRNPNTHPEDQIQLLAKLIQGHGWRAPVTVSTRSGLIVRGHGRYMAAQLLKAAVVPVDYQDYESEALEFADLIADNRIAELAAVDLPTLKDLLVDLDTGEFDMDLTGFNEAALGRMMTAVGKPAQLPDPGIQGTGELARRVIIVFDNEIQEEEFWTKLESVPAPGRVVYPWSDLR